MCRRIRRFFHRLWYGVERMAILGYDEFVSSLYSAGTQRLIQDGFTAVSSGEVQSITLLAGVDCTTGVNVNRLCLYEYDSVGDGNALLSNSDTGERLADSVAAGDPAYFWNTWNYTGTKPRITEGKTYGLSFTNGTTRPSFTGLGGSQRVYNGVGSDTAPANPAGTPSTSGVNLNAVYVTYIEGSGGLRTLMTGLPGVRRMMGG